MLPTICTLARIEVPSDRTIDGKNVLSTLKSSNAPSPHEGVFAIKGGKLVCVRSGKWKLHAINPGSSDMRQLPDEESVN
ncbi:MAG: hypothetical protein GY903_14675 [Fuerstiella sp.]|nr:hypothetical protein [Fuerstiella sp.]MCP4855730.1 hypothetical protein [Fuerstiella sp.]